MKIITIREAMHLLSKLVDEMLETGIEVLTRRGKQVCRISPVELPPLEVVDWKTIHEEMDRKLCGVPEIEFDIAARMRKDERF